MKFYQEVKKNNIFPEKWCILLITTEEYVNKIDELAQQFDKIEYDDYGSFEGYSTSKPHVYGRHFLIKPVAALTINDDGSCFISENVNHLSYDCYGKYNICGFIKYLEDLGVPIFYYIRREEFA